MFKTKRTSYFKDTLNKGKVKLDKIIAFKVIIIYFFNKDAFSLFLEVDLNILRDKEINKAI